jgi:peptidoglycan/xylan/chitin deacetylase (PgdA/CDA1 family)
MYWIDPAVRARHAEATRQLSPEQLATLTGHGWEIGSHSRTHRLLSRLDDGELDDELARSRDEVIEMVGSCTAISYPWGEVDERVVAAAGRAGYSSGTGLAGRYRWTDPLRMPRIAIAGVDGSFRITMKTSQAFWLARRSVAWSLLETARGLAGERDRGAVPLGERLRLRR